MIVIQPIGFHFSLNGILYLAATNPQGQEWGVMTRKHLGSLHYGDLTGIEVKALSWSDFQAKVKESEAWRSG